MLGQFERANEEWAEAYRIAAELDADSRALRRGVSGGPRTARVRPRRGASLGERRASNAAEPPASLGREALASDRRRASSTAVAGDADAAQREVLRRRSRSRDGSATRKEPACRSAASPSWPRSAATSSDALDSLPPVARGVRGDRRPCRGSADPLRDGLDAPPARRPRRSRAAFFFDSVQAYTDVASVRGVGLSLIGLAATEAVEHRPRRRRADRRGGGGLRSAGGHRQRLLRRDAGTRFVEQARAALPADELARATEVGRRLTIKEALDLARAAEPVTAKSTGAR